MRRIEDVLSDYDVNKRSDRKKIRIVEWFQTQPGQRFDVSEVHHALGDDLEIGQGQVRNYLKELAEENVLETVGEKRIAYQLEDDIIVPARYQARSALKQLIGLFDIDRWGISGVFMMATSIWTILTLPFWVLWGALIVSPQEQFGTVGQSEFLILALSMTVWLVVLLLLTSGLYRLRRWNRTQELL